MNAQTNTSGVWQYTVSSAQATITGYTGSGGAVTIPSDFSGVPVRKIGNDNSPIFGRPNLSVISITIPNSVTSIGGGAFADCDNLVSVTIPNSVTNILTGAFFSCSSLTNATIGDGVTSIGASAFDSCYKLTSVTLGNSVTNIGTNAFSRCTSLTSVTIPNSVTTITEGAFGDCTNLASVTLGNSVTTIGNSAFYNCSRLTSLAIPNSVTNISNSAFESCSSVTNVVVGTGVSYLGYGAFGSMASLQSIRFSGNAPSYNIDPFDESYYTIPPFILYYTQGTTGWGSTFAGRQTTMIINFSLTLTSDLNKGSIVNFPSGNSFPLGTSVSVSAVPLAGYAFTAWSGDSASTNNPLVLGMNTNKAVTANFGPDNRDTDGDGLNNYQEVIVFNTNPNQAESNSPVAGLFLASQYQSNWTNGRNAGRAEVTTTPNSFGLFNSNQMLDLKFGGMVIAKTNNQLVLTYQINQSTNLTNWTSYRQESLVISNVPADKMFLRLNPKQ